MKYLAEKTKEASKALLQLTFNEKQKIFDNLITNLNLQRAEIIKQNHLDIEIAKEKNLSRAMIDRLLLDDVRIDSIIDGVKEIKDQKEVVGKIYDEFVNETGMKIGKQRVPLGVILMIFESRPNVVIDCAALALKSNNTIILKGGKEAKYSNQILGRILHDSIKDFLPLEVVTVLASDSREQVSELLKLNECIDVVVPRGGEGLVKYVTENARMPVIAHYKGICHMYIDQYANLDKAMNLVINAKTQRPGVCNSIETLIIHEAVLPDFAMKLGNELHARGTLIKADENFRKFYAKDVEEANETDWQTEYLDNIISIKTVSSLKEAIVHIHNYGSHHSECIVSENESSCETFIAQVDASCVMVNASTRFNDGSQLGLGAELGISTTKIHAYGPMGIEQMTTSRYVVKGDGHVRV